MDLIVFDLDGTLSRTNDVDRDCYNQALADVMELTDLNTAWETYDHVTDEGIVGQIFRERFGRSMSEEEGAAIRSRLMELFTDRQRADVQVFSAVPGAGRLLERLRAEGVAIAVATGAWRCSAEFKIQHAGLPLAGVPAAFAEDGPSRESVINAAITRAREHHEVPRFDRILSVGDGIWDVRTARNLGLPFVGVASGDGAAALHEAGARHVVPDFLDLEGCLRLFGQAEVPANAIR